MTALRRLLRTFNYGEVKLWDIWFFVGCISRLRSIVKLACGSMESLLLVLVNLLVNYTVAQLVNKPVHSSIDLLLIVSMKLPNPSSAVMLISMQTGNQA